jgi:hypothetical protein
MNAIIQCLVATPILDSYLVNREFSERRQPMTASLANIAKNLLAN